jgi:hypothetical protein
MAHAISTAQIDPVDIDALAPFAMDDLQGDSADVRPEASVDVAQAEVLPDDGSEPLLRAVALQRPACELIELVMILNEAGQSHRAQEILDIAAALRPVEELATMIPQLADPQVTNTLDAAAHQRPIEEVAHLVTILTDTGYSPLARQILHTTAAQRRVDELAQLVGHLYGTPDTPPQTQQARWKLRR